MANYRTVEVKTCTKDGQTAGRNILLIILCIQTHHNIKVHVSVVDTFHKMAMNFWVPVNAGNFRSIRRTACVSKTTLHPPFT
jgi:hypothetical protein